MEKWQAHPDEVDQIVRGQYANPFAILGLQQPHGLWVARTFIPHAEQVSAFTLAGKPLGDLARRHEDGLLRRACSDRSRPAHPLPRLQRGRRMGRVRPVQLRPRARPDGRLLHRRRHAPAALRQARRALHRVRGRQGRSFRRLGAQRAPRLGRGCVQRLGRPPASDAQPLRDGRLGSVHPDARAGHGLQIRDRRPGRQAAYRSRQTLTRGNPSSGRRRHPSSPIRRPTPGATRNTSRPAARRIGGGRRSRSTRCIWVPGASAPTAAS